MTCADLDDMVYEGAVAALELCLTLPDELADVGRGWYPTIKDTMRLWSLDTGYSIYQCAGVLALYSRNQRWRGNKTLAHDALYHGNIRGMTPVCQGVRAVLALPRDAGYRDVLALMTNGSKTRHFYTACQDMPACPADRWMFDIWQLPQSERYYHPVVRGVLIVARELGLALHHTQSLCWMGRLAREPYQTSIYYP